MNCIKCNSEVPDGAKFCPSCGAFFGDGADAQPAAEQKLYCEKCGLELQKGARFCTVCGGAAKASDVKPVNDAGNVSAVSLDKPSQADSLVSAMNSAAQEASNQPKPSDAISNFGVPTPSNSVPTPSNSVPTPSNSVPTPSNVGSAGFSTGTGFSAGVSGTGTAAPAYADPMGGAAAAVAPVKKKGGKIGIIIAAVIAVIVGSVAALFFTNKAAFLSVFMGKSGYATMVEGNSIKDITGRIDAPAISNGIKSASGVVSAVASTGVDMSDFAYMSDTASTGLELDTAALIEALNESLTEAFGANSVKVTAGANITLTDSAKTLIGSNDELNELLELINGTSITYKVTANDKAASVSAGTEGKIAIDVKTLMTEDGYLYMMFPFASDKAIMIKCDAPSDSADSENTAVLELDEKEIERLIGEVVEIYLENYKESAIEMEDGSIKAAGVTAEGKLITAEFKGDALEKLFSDIGEHIAEDEYFCDKIVDYVKECGGELSKSEYRKSIIDAFSFEATKNDKLIIETVIDKSGNVLAKSYTAKADNGDKAYIAYVNTKDKDAVEFAYDDGYDEVVISAVNEKTSSTAGTVTLVIEAEGESLTLNIDYSGVEVVEFLNQKVAVGTYELSVKLPKDFTEMLTDEGAAAISGAKLIFSTEVDGNTLKEAVSLSVPQYGSITLSADLTASNDTSDLDVPSDTIDITPLYTGDYNASADIYDQLSDFMDEVMKAVEDLDLDFDLDIPGFDYDDDWNWDDDDWNWDDDDWNWDDDDWNWDDDYDYGWEYDPEYDIPELMEWIEDDISSMQDYINDYDLTADELAKANSIIADYQSLYSRIQAKGTDATEDEYEAFDDEYWEILFEAWDFETEFWNSRSAVAPQQ